MTISNVGSADFNVGGSNIGGIPLSDLSDTANFDASLEGAGVSSTVRQSSIIANANINGSPTPGEPLSITIRARDINTGQVVFEKTTTVGSGDSLQPFTGTLDLTSSDIFSRFPLPTGQSTRGEPPANFGATQTLYDQGWAISTTLPGGSTANPSDTVILDIKAETLPFLAETFGLSPAVLSGTEAPPAWVAGNGGELAFGITLDELKELQTLSTALYNSPTPLANPDALTAQLESLSTRVETKFIAGFNEVIQAQRPDAGTQSDTSEQTGYGIIHQPTSDGITQILGSSPTSDNESPTLLSPGQTAIEFLSVNTFQRNINPTVRTIINDIRADVSPIQQYDTTVGDSQVKADVINVLSRGGFETGLDAAADNIITLAKELDVDAANFTGRLVRSIGQSEALTDTYGSSNPLVVNSGIDPSSRIEATNYVSGLFSEGIFVPGGWGVPNQVSGEFEFEGVPQEILERDALVTNGTIQDIDGVSAISYGASGIDVTATRTNGDTTHLFLRLDEPLPGKITDYVGVGLERDERTAIFTVETPDGEIDIVRLPLTETEAGILEDSRGATGQFVEGLGARYFPSESVDFLTAASDVNLSNNLNSEGVVLPTIVLNTFGSVGEDAFRGSPAQLVTSLARSLEPGEQTTEPLASGLFATPEVPTYSGGSTVTLGELVMQPFGLSSEQAQGLGNVAEALPELVARLSERYDLSSEATVAWHDAIFANPDIPSVILPGSVVTELAGRTDASHPGQTLRALQDDIETSVQGLLERNGLGDIVTLHHTPTGSTEDNPDAVAPHIAGLPLEETPEFTTEWQFAVNGQKALPVLDVTVDYLQQHHGVDLKGALEEEGFDYGRIREFSLEETIEFFAETVKPMIDNFAEEKGLETLTGKVIVAADTYVEKDGSLSGSDSSMIRSAQALYGADNVVIVQVDTFGGQPPSEPGRNPKFTTEPFTDSDGQQGVRLLTPSVDPEGDNAEAAPSLYVTTQQEFGAIFKAALENQLPLSQEELSTTRDR